MIAALAVLGLVVDDAVLDFDLAGIEVALEVGGVVLRIPQAELDAGENAERLPRSVRRLVTVSCQIFKVLVERNKVARMRLDAARTSSR